jgi:hypothetical protein
MRVIDSLWMGGYNVIPIDDLMPNHKTEIAERAAPPLERHSLNVFSKSDRTTQLSW